MRVVVKCPWGKWSTPNARDPQRVAVGHDDVLVMPGCVRTFGGRSAMGSGGHASWLRAVVVLCALATVFATRPEAAVAANPRTDEDLSQQTVRADEVRAAAQSLDRPAALAAATRARPPVPAAPRIIS